MNKCNASYSCSYINANGITYIGLPWLRDIVNYRTGGGGCANCKSFLYCNGRIRNVALALLSKMTRDEYKEILARDTDTVRDFEVMVK